MMFECSMCRRPISLSDRINYGDAYMCPACVYEMSPEGSPAREQMLRNYSEWVPVKEVKKCRGESHTAS